MPLSQLTNPVDIHIGGRLDRVLHIGGITMAELAIQLGTDAARIERYMAGTERVGPAMLFDICRVIDVELAWFYGPKPLPRQHLPRFNVMFLS
jgi:transcriptional regulator with XRE-family HTH domain